MNKTIYSGTIWEKQVAYSRARRVGNIVAVAGTTAVDHDGEIVAPGDIGAQAEFIFEKIERALRECDASLKDVVRTRMFVTSIENFDAIARAHRNAFEGIDPVASCIQISGLVDPRLLIEIEVDAIVAS